jgi:hypothetical protein
MGRPGDRPVFGCGQETQCRRCSAAKTLRTHRGVRCDTRGKGRSTARETGRLELVKLDGSGGVEGELESGGTPAAAGSLTDSNGAMADGAEARFCCFAC